MNKREPYLYFVHNSMSPRLKTFLFLGGGALPSTMFLAYTDSTSGSLNARNYIPVNVSSCSMQAACLLITFLFLVSAKARKVLKKT